MLHNHRIVLLDIAKGIGILLVFLGHSLSWSGDGGVKIVLHSFHMPLFFFLSGVTFGLREDFRSRFLKIAYKIFRGLFFPFFFFTIVSFVALRFLPQAVPVTLGQLKTWIILFLRGISFSDGPLWFLPVLAICQMFAWFLFYIFKYWALPAQRIFSILTLLLYVVGCCFMALGGRRYIRFIPLYCAVLPFSFIYFYMGMQFANIFVKLNEDWNTLCIVLNVLCAACFVSIFAVRLPRLRLAWLEMGHPIFAPIVASVGIFMIIAISTLLIRIHIIRLILLFIGENSLFYFSLDSLVGRYLCILF